MWCWLSLGGFSTFATGRTRQCKGPVDRRTQVLFMQLFVRMRARDVVARSAILVVEVWLALLLASPLRAGPMDREVAEWVILNGGSVRLKGQDERIRELTKLPAADFHLELADLVGTNI